MTATQQDGMPKDDTPKEILLSRPDETAEAYGRRLADFLYERATKSLDDPKLTRQSTAESSPPVG